jgi:glycosyltransferase involved in cell wall biosynthesis
MALIAPLLHRPLVIRNAGSGEFGGVQLMRRMPLGPLGLKLMARAATGVSLNAEMTREMRDAGFRRVVEIPNGVEVPPETTPEGRAAARQRLGIDGPMALYIGRLEREKGVGLLLQAWRQLDIEGAKLLIVGDGPEQESLLGNTREAQTNSIRLVGTSSDVRPYLQAADLFALPSRSEGISNALLEAMASGLAVVATDVGGNRHVIRNPDVGTLVPALQAERFRDALRGLLLSPELRRAQGIAARNYVAAHYSADRMVDAYEQLYLDLTRVSGPQR